MAKKAAVKADPTTTEILEKLIDDVVENMSELGMELGKATSVAAAAKRARLLTSTPAKQFKEFRAVSVAHFKK